MRGKQLIAALAAALASAAGAAAPLDLTLERAVVMALANQRTLRNAEYALRGNELGVATARSDFELKVVPTGTVGRIGDNALTTTTGFNGSVGIQLSRRFETGTVIAAGPSYNRSGNDRNTTLTASLDQPLLRGWDSAITLDPVRRAEYAAATSQRALEMARANAALETIAAYYGVLREQRLTEFAESQGKRIGQHTAIAESKERSGLIGPMDLLRARVRLKDAEDATNQAHVTLQQAMNRLRRALDVPLDTDLKLRAPAEARVEGFDPERDAVEGHPDIVQLRADLDEAIRSADVAHKNITPEITLHVAAGQVTQVNPFLVQFVPTTQQQWSVYLQASSDLRRTAEKNAYQQALLRVDSARFALETRTEEIRRQVREQRLQLADSRMRIELRDEQKKEAETRLALAEVKFSHDMASNLDVMDAETELQRAEASAATARADYAIGVYQLRAMAGRLLDAFEGRT